MLVALLAGCGERGGDAADVRAVIDSARIPDARVEAARAILRRASPAVAAGALRRLETTRYVVGVHFREVNPEGELIRRWRREIERAPDPSGDREETLLGEVLANQGGALALLRYVDPIDLLLPDDPLYLRDDNGDYAITLLRTRHIAGRRVIGAQARRRQGVDEPILVVRSWVDVITAEPVAVELIRASSSVLLSEQARVVVTLATQDDETLLPATARVDAMVNFLAESPRRYNIDLPVTTPSISKDEEATAVS